MFSFDATSLNTPHPAKVLQRLFCLMHIHLVFLPQLVHELTIPDYALDSHAVHLGVVKRLYFGFTPFASRPVETGV